MTKRQPTPEHLAALAQGRAEGAAVRNYLHALQTVGKKKRGRQPKGAEAIQTEIDECQDPVDRLKLRAALREAQLREAMASGADMEELEQSFIKHALSYSQRHGLVYGDWRQEGVDAAVLKAAGISRSQHAVT